MEKIWAKEIGLVVPVEFGIKTGELLSFNKQPESLFIFLSGYFFC